MDNPCRSCAHHLAGGDKNADRCRKCAERVGYLQRLDGRSGNGPAPASPPSTLPPPASKRSDELPATLSTKVCNLAKCPHGGVPQPLSDFDNNRTSVDGKQPHCKDCRRQMQNMRSKRPAKKKKVCANPDCPHNGKAQPVSNFTTSSKWCKDCRQVADQKYVARQTKSAKAACSAPVPVSPTGTAVDIIVLLHHERDYHLRRAGQLDAAIAALIKNKEFAGGDDHARRGQDDKLAAG